MRRALTTCSCQGCPGHTGACPQLVESGRCTGCQRTADRKRGTARQRGYGHRHETRFRRKVLRRNPVCVLCHAAPATVADHYPRGRDELVLLGLDPDDPQYGRGLCQTCDSAQTAQRQPGGFNIR